MITKGAPNYTFNVISPELPSGSAWLANCLIELGVSVWNPWDVIIPNEWIQLSETLYQYNDANNNWKQTLPSLKNGHIYNFDQPLSASFSHRWPQTVDSDLPTIVFVRDPRDLLFSQWRRLKFNKHGFNLALGDFVDARYHHFPISNQEYLLLFMHHWKLFVESNNGMVVRFEDYRRDPVLTLKAVQEFLGLTVDDTLINRAVKQSDFTVCQQVENHMADTGRLKRKYNFSATAFEYKQRNDDIGLMSSFQPICDWLNYELGIVNDSENVDVMSEMHIKQLVDDILIGGENFNFQDQMIHSFSQSGVKCNWRYK